MAVKGSLIELWLLQSVWGTPNSWTAHFMENTTCGRVLGAGRGLPSAEDNFKKVVSDVHRQSKLR